MFRKYWIAGVITLGIAVAAVVLYATRSTPLRGTRIDPPWPAPEFSLADQGGSAFTMSAQRGKVVLLYFGYVNCPDECPLTMAHIKVALGTLGPRAADVRVAMVSTDPARDTPQALQEFMDKFDPSFRGLTGSLDELQQVWKDYGVAVEAGGETHSTYLYVVDRQGNIRETFLPDSEPADIGADLRTLLNSQ